MKLHVPLLIVWLIFFATWFYELKNVEFDNKVSITQLYSLSITLAVAVMISIYANRAGQRRKTEHDLLVDAVKDLIQRSKAVRKLFFAIADSKMKSFLR